MVWQDALVTGVQVWLAVALVPALPVRAARPPLLTCWGTGVGLALIAGAFGTLGLWLSCVTAATVATEWLYLGVRR